MKRSLLSFIPLSLSLLLGCDQQFDPREPLRPQFVIFSILSTDRNVQYVRVEQNYRPSDFNPLEYTADNGVIDAIVTISDGRSTFRLSDTTLPRSDTSRYSFPIRSHVLRDFTAGYGQSYLISAASLPLGKASASVLVPTKPSVSAEAVGLVLLDRPDDFDDEATISFTIVLSSSARGYRGRMFADYDVLKGTEWVQERAEVPLSFYGPLSKDLRYATYPELTVRPSRNQTSVVFGKPLYKAVLTHIADEKYKSHKLIFKWVVFQFMQVDKNLFNYYNTVHYYRDPHSMRLDEPAFSNVSNGYGLVGAYTLDSLVHLLPENFSSNNR